MDEKEKRSLIKKYFADFPKWAVAIAIFGLIGIAANAVVGIILLLVGIVFTILLIKGKPTDSQIDEWLKEDLNNLSERAISKFGVDKTDLIKTQNMIPAFPMNWISVASDQKHKKGKDGIIRFTPIDVSIINYGKDQLFFYRCILDFITGAVLNEETHEFYYKDIVSASTITESVKITLKGNQILQLNSAEVFYLKNSGGDKLGILSSDATLAAKLGGGEIQKKFIEETIKSIRDILREKKK